MQKSTVAIVKCESYDRKSVLDALQKGLDLLGGTVKFVKPGERILLKPNILWGTDPDKCVVTHPSVFYAAASIFCKAGAQVYYGDSPAIQSSAGGMKKSGHADVASELCLKPAEFDHGRIVSYPKGVTSKALYIADGVTAAEAVISLPKFKTHGLTRFTGAIKNQFGCVPGMKKGQYHAQFPDIFEFSGLLADITGFVNPRLYIMDAVYGMEGNGPQSGDPRKIGALILSSDPVALDTVCCRIINLDPSFVPTIQAGERTGLGTSDFSRIDLKGDSIDNFMIPDFKVNRTAPVPLPKNRFLKELKSQFTQRPAIRRRLCTKCGRCTQICPTDPKSVFFRKSKTKPPVYDYRNCIRCFCCQEMCPSKAIEIHTPILNRLLPFVTYIGLLASRRNSHKGTN